MNPKEVGYYYLKEKYKNQFMWVHDTNKILTFKQHLSQAMLFCITDNINTKQQRSYDDF